MERSCSQIQGLLSAYMDGELPRQDDLAVAAHLEVCAGCRVELAGLQALDAALANLTPPMPAGLADKVLARLPQPRSRWRGWLQALPLAACLVLGLALGGHLAQDYYPLAAPMAHEGDTASLEMFQDFTQGSLGAVMASYHPEEGNGS